MIDNHKHWQEKLPFALLGYRTTIRTSTGATPYFLVYGTEAVIPAEVEIPSLRIIQEAKLSDADWIRGRAENLALIDEEELKPFVMVSSIRIEWPELSTRRLNPDISHLGNWF